MNPSILRSPDGAYLVQTEDGTFSLAEAWALVESDAPAPCCFADLLSRYVLRTARLEELSEAWRASGMPFLPPRPLRAPPFRPRKILALGRNYAAHAREMGAAPAAPFFFDKLPSCCIGHGMPIEIPHDLEGPVHHEAELAVVIGRTGRRIPVDRAMDHVAAYCAINDVTARGLQAKAKEKGKPWTAAKNLDTFAPLGPGLVPADAIEDVGALRVICRVNGEVRQDGNTKDMLLPVPETIAHLSRHLTLEAGDLIATGTPAGVGGIEAGDVVEVEIAGIGILKNPVRGEESGS